MANRPITTLFMLMSVDGKISTGDTDERDFDQDLKTIPGVMEGLPQYYELEKQTDFVSFNTGRVMAKIGVNERKDEPVKINCRFVIVDNHPHLTEAGVQYLSKWVKTLYLVTMNPNHPAKRSNADNLVVLEYPKIDFRALFQELKEKHGVDRMTIQSGGTINAELVRAGLIDQLSIVVAPCLIGGKETLSLIGGEALKTQEDLQNIKALRLMAATPLKKEYLHLQYDVINNF